MKLRKRVKSKTPKFFRKVRNIGLTLAAISGTIITAPVALPAVLIKVAGYLGVASMVASAVSQTAVCEEPDNKNDNEADGS